MNPGEVWGYMAGYGPGSDLTEVSTLCVGMEPVTFLADPSSWPEFGSMCLNDRLLDQVMALEARWLSEVPQSLDTGEVSYKMFQRHVDEELRSEPDGVPLVSVGHPLKPTSKNLGQVIGDPPAEVYFNPRWLANDVRL